MASLFLSTFCVFWILVSLVTVAADIDSCPNDYTPPPPKNVHDLHPHHIETIATIGDSITAGVLAINTKKSHVDGRDLIQYRGLSWLSGADRGAKSIYNYVKHYNSGVYGGSIGKRNLPLCEETFFCLNASSIFKQDVLNAAMPAAVTDHLKNQVNYLNEHMGATSPYAKKWKMINVFLGTNDLSDPQNFVCICCRATAPVEFIGQEVISFHVSMYNSVLKQLAADYGPGGSLGSDTFTVVYQPFGFDVTSLPVTAISNVDGYHPNVMAYEYFTRTMWNQIFRPKAEKIDTFRYETTSKLYCPTEKDRIRTD
ncbi:hypothetical protein [Absidia glauca]|uniref:SGNH hydrolase-type esterase domain-containing protein n=1 Tax=Absidia glauca TaxID=4829 RepID=A0A163JQP7_ABSGL|nr:hypothetical protein [Absidia glauca]